MGRNDHDVYSMLFIMWYFNYALNRSLNDPPGIPAFFCRQKPPNSVQVVTTAISKMTRNMVSISTVPDKSNLRLGDVTTSISPGKVRASYSETCIGCMTVVLLHSQSLPIKRNPSWNN